MDPDSALASIKSLIYRVLEDEGLTPWEAVQLAQIVSGLDDWLSHGGFLPERWTR